MPHRAPHLPGRIRAEGKPTTTRIGAFRSGKAGGGWKLLARQGSGCGTGVNRGATASPGHGFAGARPSGWGVWGPFRGPHIT